MMRIQASQVIGILHLLCLKNRKIKKIKEEDVVRPLPKLMAGGMLKDTVPFQAAISASQKATIPKLADFSALSTQIGDICGRTDLKGEGILAVPLRSEDLFGGITKAPDSLVDIFGKGLLHSSVMGKAT